MIIRHTSSETRHSPGPWSQDPEGDVAYTIEDATGQPICDVYLKPEKSFTLTRAQGQANTHLIEAAPILLEAAKQVYANLVDQGTGKDAEILWAAISRAERRAI